MSGKREKRRQRATEAADAKRRRVERERRDRASKVRERGPEKAQARAEETAHRVEMRGLEVNTRVAIIRTEHGWYDGRVTGKVVGNDGSGYTVLGDDGETYECRHKRDVRKILY